MILGVFLLALLFGSGEKQMKWLMQWPNLLLNPEPVLIVICPLAQAKMGVMETCCSLFGFLIKLQSRLPKKKKDTRCFEARKFLSR